MAGGGGLEPPLPGPEPGVLPLDDPPAALAIVRGRHRKCQASGRRNSAEWCYWSESRSERLGLERGAGTGGSRRGGARGRRGVALVGRIPERAARLEARDATGRDPDGLAGARIAPVPLGAPAQEK